MKFVLRLVVIIFSLVIVLIIVNLLTDGLIKNRISSIVYYTKSDVEYVSEEFNVSISRASQNGKSFTYHCTDNISGIKKYIFLDYRSKEFYIINASEGVTEFEATRLVKVAGYSTNMADLLIFMDGSDVEGDVLSELRWIVYHDSLKGSIYVDFVDGSIYLDGM